MLLLELVAELADTELELAVDDDAPPSPLVADDEADAVAPPAPTHAASGGPPVGWKSPVPPSSPPHPIALAAATTKPIHVAHVPRMARDGKTGAAAAPSGAPVQ